MALLPALRRDLNSRIDEHLANLAEDAGRWRAWADDQATIFIRRHGRRKTGEVRIDEKALKRLPEPIRAPVYFKIAETLSGKEQHLRRGHVRQIEDWLTGSGKSGLTLALGLRIRRSAATSGAAVVWSVNRS